MSESDGGPPRPRVHLPIVDAGELDRQHDRGALFHHSRESTLFDRMQELATTLQAAIDALLAKGLITRRELDKATERQRRKQDSWTKAHGFHFSPDSEDKYTAAAAEVDCDARMALCRGACCRLDFPLQVTDLKEGVVKWDHGNPYWIRHDADGRCVHQDRENGRCEVFAQRPLTCRVYTCKADKRIWIDFEGRVPNVEGIDRIFNREGDDRIMSAVFDK